jgi:hypothetical protein
MVGASQGAGNSLPGDIQRDPCFLSVCVQTGGISEILGEEREHFLHDFVINWRRRIVIQINPAHVGTMGCKCFNQQ